MRKRAHRDLPGKERVKALYYIGIDLGTSSVKLLLVDETGTVRNTVSKSYPLYFPLPGWAEQEPEDWWKACLSGLAELIRDTDASRIAGIGVGGQMHGLVALDEKDAVIRPAILWNDGRTADIAFAGFTAPKLLWMKKHEPDNYARIAKIMLPKDNINYRLTGVHACDYSDASGKSKNLSAPPIGPFRRALTSFFASGGQSGGKKRKNFKAKRG